MANEIFTRLQLKYDTLANWNLVKDTFTPLAGEVCITKVEVNDPANKLLDPIMIKVGDGTSTWGQLDWISAKAADVYAWAKKAGIDVEVVDVEGNPDGDEHVDYPIVNFAWDEVNKKLVATKGVIDAAAINVNASNGSGFSGNVEEWLKYLNELMWDYSYASEQAHNQLFETVFNNGNEDDPYVTDGSKTLIVTTDGESYNNHNAYTVKAVDIAITHDQVTDFTSAVDARIDALIAASDPDGDGNVIEDIQHLVEYVENNAGQITGLLEDVDTAKGNAANAVATANTANATAGQALEKANQALEGATGAANSAAEAEAARAAAVVAQGKAEAAQEAAEAAKNAALDANTSATAIAKEAKETANAAKEASDAATEAVENLHAIATSGSIYDIKEGSVEGTSDSDKAIGLKYLVFNCGTASTVI